jgi:hypothetical protein
MQLLRDNEVLSARLERALRIRRAYEQILGYHALKKRDSLETVESYDSDSSDSDSSIDSSDSCPSTDSSAAEVVVLSSDEDENCDPNSYFGKMVQ